jgi:hypothetical protein
VFWASPLYCVNLEKNVFFSKLPRRPKQSSFKTCIIVKLIGTSSLYKQSHFQDWWKSIYLVRIATTFNNAEDARAYSYKYKLLPCYMFFLYPTNLECLCQVVSRLVRISSPIGHSCNATYGFWWWRREKEVVISWNFITIVWVVVAMQLIIFFLFICTN